MIKIEKKKGFFKRWGEGIKNLGPADLLQAKLVGHYGTMVGTAFAATFMWFKGMWYFIILFFFIIFLQFIDSINTKKQLTQAKAIEKQLAGGENGFNAYKGNRAENKNT